jgi:uncharacterized delta-60 repeat protein
MLLCSLAAIAQLPGALDPSFGENGKVLLSLSSGQDRLHATALDAEERIVAAGYVSSTITGKDMACVRFLSDGSLDSSFGVNGLAAFDLQLGSDDIAFDLVIQSDGKIVIAGSTDDGADKNAALLRMHEDGSLDSDFGVNGVAISDLDNGLQDEFRCLKLHPITGNLVAGGSAQISSTLAKPVVARYLPSGELDTDFNGNGIRLLWITNNDQQYLHSVEDLAVQANGKISAVGWRDFPGLSWSSDYWAAKINSDGSMDNTFSSDGVNAYNGGFNGHDRAYALYLKPDNTMVLAGGGYVSTLAYDFRAFEVSTSGASLSWNTVADYGTSSNDIAQAIAVDGSGRYVFAGSAVTANASSFAVYRTLETGAADASFGTAGKVTTTFTGNAQNVCFDAVVQADNKIVAVGYSGDDMALVRYLGEVQAQLDNIILISPANNAMNVNYAGLSLSWNEPLGAVSYTYQIAVDDQFLALVANETTTSNSVFGAGLMPGTTYYWRVRASDGNVFGEYSETRVFTTNTLENFNLQTPANSAVDVGFTTVNFNWTSALGATGYQLSYATDMAFSGAEELTATQSDATVNDLNPATTYYWRVRATANGEDYGDWSAVWSFTTARPVGVGEIQAPTIQLYPNPADELLIIELSNTTVPARVEITDMRGSLVYEGTQANASQIFVGHLNGGMYVVRVMQGQHIFTQPIQIAH